MYGFTAAAPFISANQLGRPLHEVGLFLGLLAVGVSMGSAMTNRLVGRVPIERLLIGANAVSACAAMALLAFILLGELNLTRLIGLTFLFTFGAGTSSPTALTKAMGVNRKLVGSAAGLFGFSQMAVGALCTVVVGLGDNSALAAAGTLAAAGVISQSAFWIALRYEGRARL
jgi:DHA1 family bicyclomycin/chloramphenicol resistance-like MFS transporter